MVHQLKLIYRGSENGFKAKDFHLNCDNKGMSLIIIKSEGIQQEVTNIFGAFTDI